MSRNFGNNRDARRQNQESDPDLLASPELDEMRMVNSPAPGAMYSTRAVRGGNYAAPLDSPPRYSQHLPNPLNSTPSQAQTGVRHGPHHLSPGSVNSFSQFRGTFSNNMRSQAGDPPPTTDNAILYNTAHWTQGPNRFAGGAHSGTGGTGRAPGAVPLRSSNSAPPLSQSPLVQGIIFDGTSRGTTPSSHRFFGSPSGQSKSGGSSRGSSRGNSIGNSFTNLFNLNRRSPGPSTIPTPFVSTTSGGAQYPVQPTSSVSNRKGKARLAPSLNLISASASSFIRHSEVTNFEILPLTHYLLIPRDISTRHPPHCLVSFLGQCLVPGGADDGCPGVFHLRAEIPRISSEYDLDIPLPSSDERVIPQSVIRATDLKSIPLVTFRLDIDSESELQQHAQGIPHNQNGCLISMKGLCVDPECPDLRWLGFIAWYDPRQEVEPECTRQAQGSRS
ncbi:hypothetical protein BKA70DRAFT_1417055 [Coprinopsis sp. MPI-PUGE-AT-0042]|nr:hypothetical protein BKA70DRAFT_1417055 [Coprinopsis sp. MPI-PUGE-AT-0042]